MNANKINSLTALLADKRSQIAVYIVEHLAANQPNIPL